MVEYLSVSRTCSSSLVATFHAPFRILCWINPAFSSLGNQTYQIRNRHRKREFYDQLICIVSNS